MAAVDYFIKFDGIKGGSTDAKHKDEIDIEAWSWGETNSGAGRARAAAAGPEGLDAGLPLHDEAEQGELGLMEACATGQHIKSAVLTARKAGKGQLEYLTFKFYDVLVSSVPDRRIRAERHGEMDSVSLNFAKIEVEYKPQKPDGSAGPPDHFGWDLKANKSY